MLMSVPNVSEGVDREAVAAIGAAFAPAHLLDTHSDPDHHRSVYTLAAEQGVLAGALADGAAEAHRRISVVQNSGVHPHVGAVDVVPVVYRSPEQRGAACAEALTAADMISRATATPVFLYGELSHGRERAELRAGGAEALAARIASGEQRPDFGPLHLHPSGGATLLAARPPLVAFNLELDPAVPLERARQVAAELRESGGGLPGVRAIGLWLDARGRAQVSCNLHDPFATPLAAVVEFVAARTELVAAELVGLVPADALSGLPADLPFVGADPAERTIEGALEALS